MRHRASPTSEIVMVGDFNQLSDTVLTQRTGLTQIVNQPTRGSNFLDRIFQSSPLYTGVKVVTSTLKATTWPSLLTQGVSRKISIKSELFYNIVHALLIIMLLFWISSLTLTGIMLSMQLIHNLLLINFTIVLSLLNTFYPLSTVTVTNRDPYFVSP